MAVWWIRNEPTSSKIAVMSTLMTSSNEQRTTSAFASPGATAAWLLVALAGAVGVGTSFGMLSRIYDDSNTGWGELGSPWALVAFTVGAVTARSTRFSPFGLKGITVIAAAAAATALVVAIAVNYRTGLASVLPIGRLTHARGWGIAALGAGSVFGLLGSLWGRNTSTRLTRPSAIALATILTGEAALGIIRGQYLTAIDRGSLRISTFHMYAILLAVGLTISAAAARPHCRFRMASFTIALTVPAAIFIDHVYASIY